MATPELPAAPKFSVMQHVRVRSVPALKRPFVAKDRRDLAGQEVVIALAEVGRYSRNPMYTVTTRRGERTGVLFENELEAIG